MELRQIQNRLTHIIGIGDNWEKDAGRKYIVTTYDTDFNATHREVSRERYLEVVVENLVRQLKYLKQDIGEQNDVWGDKG